MTIVRVKICGNTRKEDVLNAIDAGADAIGCILGFPSTPRNLDIQQAYHILDDLPPFVHRVVVTNQDNPDLLRKISEKLHFDAVQLIGKSPYNSKLRRLFQNKHLIRVMHSEPNKIMLTALKSSKLYDTILIDSKVNGKPGGTGQVHNWTLAGEVVEAIRPTPTILAGGLNQENVEEAIRTVKPYAVDVSSGVESSPGIKDHSKIERFIINAKRVRI
jgi:phosphoribosylanthranilate isomerase